MWSARGRTAGLVLAIAGLLGAPVAAPAGDVEYVIHVSVDGVNATS